MDIIVWGLALFGAYMLWKNVIKKWLLQRKLPFVTNRGLLAVKAASYLLMLEAGESVDKANAQTKQLDIEMPTFLILTAKDFINLRYGGKQLPMIAEARAKGFNS